MAKNSGNLLGAWAFLIGFLIAVVLGLFGQSLQNSVWLYTVLAVLGLIVGLLNISDSEVKDFMLAGVVLVLVSSLGAISLASVPFVSGILDALVVLFVPATIVVALKSLFALGRR